MYKELISVEGDFKRLVEEYSVNSEQEDVGESMQNLTEMKQTDTKKEASPASPILKEEAAVGKVEWRVYYQYIKAFSLPASIMSVCVWTAYQLGQVGVNVWLKHWSDRSTAGDKNVVFYLAVYGIIGLAYTSLSFVQSIVVRSYGSVKSARTLHYNMLYGVLR
jgi:hypothetical protein